MSLCTCTDTTQTNTFTCYNDKCKLTWKVPLDSMERKSKCPEHKHTVAMCGGGRVSLCTKCLESGLYLIVDRSRSMWAPTYKIGNKSDK